MFQVACIHKHYCAEWLKTCYPSGSKMYRELFRLNM